MEASSSAASRATGLQHATRLQIGVFVICAINALWSLAGLIANPDFATGDAMTAERVLGVDFNGWHAVSGLLIFVPGMVLARRDDWARLFALVAIPSIAIPGIWALIDQTPLGIWPFEHNESDAILHFAVAGSFALLLFATRGDRRGA
jgi:hypothetical protein